MMLLINLMKIKRNFFRLNITKDPTIEFSREIEFDKTSQNKKIQNNNLLIEWKLTNGDKFPIILMNFHLFFKQKTPLFL